jgi:hypothetical protein
MAKKKPSGSHGEADAQGAASQPQAPAALSPAPGVLAFNLVMAVFGLFVAAILFSFGIQWTGQGNPAAGMGLILAGLFIFWRGGKRLSWTCAEIKMRRQK